MRVLGSAALPTSPCATLYSKLGLTVLHRSPQTCSSSISPAPSPPGRKLPWVMAHVCWERWGHIGDAQASACRWDHVRREHPSWHQEEASGEPCLAPEHGGSPLPRARRQPGDMCCMEMGAHHITDMKETPVPPDIGVQWDFQHCHRHPLTPSHPSPSAIPSPAPYLLFPGEAALLTASPRAKVETQQRHGALGCSVVGVGSVRQSH